MNRYRYTATPRFWRNFRKLTENQRQSAKQAWRIFKQNPFDPRLRTHRINALSSLMGRTVHAVVVEGDLRVVFYVDGSTVVCFNIGSHDIYRV